MRPEVKSRFYRNLNRFPWSQRAWGGGVSLMEDLQQ